VLAPAAGDTLLTSAAALTVAWQYSGVAASALAASPAPQWRVALVSTLAGAEPFVADAGELKATSGGGGGGGAPGNSSAFSAGAGLASFSWSFESGALAALQRQVAGPSSAGAFFVQVSLVQAAGSGPAISSGSGGVFAVAGQRGQRRLVRPH
jgi:hypothetical protein